MSIAQVEEFTALRPLLFSVAYRLLGTASDVDDVLQDAWLRYEGAAGVRDPKPYLVQVVTRLCLDLLGSARVRRERYVGPWLPEPVLTGASAAVAGAGADPDPFAAVERREQLSLGALTMLEQLTPAEHRRLLDALLAAFSTGDTEALVELLRADAAVLTDGGGEVKAALRPVVGRDKVARLLAALWPTLPEGAEVAAVELNGLPALVAYLDGRPLYTMSLDVVDGRVARLLVVAAPSKLRHTGPPPAQ